MRFLPFPPCCLAERFATPVLALLTLVLVILLLLREVALVRLLFAGAMLTKSTGTRFIKRVNTRMYGFLPASLRKFWIRRMVPLWGEPRYTLCLRRARSDILRNLFIMPVISRALALCTTCPLQNAFETPLRNCSWPGTLALENLRMGSMKRHFFPLRSLEICVRSCHMFASIRTVLESLDMR